MKKKILKILFIRTLLATASLPPVVSHRAEHDFIGEIRHKKHRESLMEGKIKARRKVKEWNFKLRNHRCKYLK